MIAMNSRRYFCGYDGALKYSCVKIVLRGRGGGEVRGRGGVHVKKVLRQVLMILINSRTKEFHSVSDYFHLSIPSSFCVDDWNPYCFPQQQKKEKRKKKKKRRRRDKKKATRNRPVEESGVDC